jgi:hypothetical protein
MTQVGPLSMCQQRVWSALLHLVFSFSLVRASHQSNSVFGIVIFEDGHCSCILHFTAVSFFMLVRHGGFQPPRSPLYDGLFWFWRSHGIFKLQIGTRQETISTHRLKPCHAYQDVQVAEPSASKPVPPLAKCQPSCVSGLAFANCIKTFPPGFSACQSPLIWFATAVTPIPLPVLPDIASGRHAILYTLGTKILTCKYVGNGDEHVKKNPYNC